MRLLRILTRYLYIFISTIKVKSSYFIFIRLLFIRFVFCVVNEILQAGRHYRAYGTSRGHPIVRFWKDKLLFMTVNLTLNFFCTRIPCYVCVVENRSKGFLSVSINFLLYHTVLTFDVYCLINYVPDSILFCSIACFYNRCHVKILVCCISSNIILKLRQISHPFLRQKSSKINKGLMPINT